MHGFADAVQDRLEIFRVADEIHIVRVDDEHGRIMIRAQVILFVRLVELIDVAAFHVALVGAIAHGDPFHQRVGARAQVNHQLGFGDLLGQRFLHTVIHLQFVAAQVDAGKEGVLLEGIVRNERLGLGQPVADVAALLMVAAEQEEDLRLEGVALAVGVKVAQKGVLFKDFQHQFGVEAGLQHARQRSFANTDNTFDRKVHESLQWGDGFSKFKIYH